jgi:hypothetical protein
MKTTLSMLLAFLAVSSQAQVTQNFESGDKAAEQARGWVFAAQGVTNAPLPTGSSAIQGTYSVTTNQLSSNSLSASWVKTPWLTWTPGTISLDARLSATGVNTYKVLVRFISYSKGSAFDEGSTSDTLFEYTMANNTNVQNISFPVPALVLDGNPWRMRVNFVGTGGSTRLIHDNWSMPALAIVQDFESGSATTEQGKGWVFGAQGIGTNPGGVGPIQGSYGAQTNQLSNSSLTASWVKTPWAIWKAGTISIDAKLNQTGADTYKAVVRFIPWNKCGANEEGTTTDVLYEYTMSNNTDVQTINFPVPDTLLDGKPWRMRVSFIGTGGSTRIVHDNWFLPAASAFYDTDGDNIPDAMDKYPGDNTNNGKSAILTRVWNDLDADGIQDNCEPGIMGVSVTRGTSTETTRYNGYAAFFDFTAGSQTLAYAKPANTFAYYTLENEGSDDAVDSDVCGSGRTTFSVSGVSSNVAVGFTTPRVTQNFESGDRPAEIAKGWEFGGTTVNSTFTGGGSAVQGTWSAQSNALSSSSLSSSWVKTPWMIWAAGNFSMDARLNATGANTYKVIFRFIPWNSCNNFQQGTITSAVHEFTMANTLDVQNISFPVPSTVLDGKPWKIQVSFIGTGGSSRIVHDNWSAPGAAAFYDTDSDNIPDAMDEYPADNTNDGKAAIFARAWNDKDGDGIQDDCGAGIEGATVSERNSTGNMLLSTATTRYNGYVAFFCIPAANNGRVLEFAAPGGFAVALQDQGSDETLDSDIGSNGRTASFTATGVVSNLAGGFLAPGSVTTFVWDDQDADGIQDAGEPGLGNVTVQLRNWTGNMLVATTVTNASGVAVFENVATNVVNGYRLRYVLPTGHTITTADAGSDDAADSDADPTTTMSPGFALTQGGQNYTLTDCGMWAPGTVNSFVWDDQDGDGIQDAGEPGLSGVTVSLRNHTGNMQLGSATTNASGIATITNVPTNRDVRLRYTLPSGRVISAADQGSDDALDSDADVTTRTTPTFKLTQGSQTYTLMDCGMKSSSLRIAQNEPVAIKMQNNTQLNVNGNAGNAVQNQPAVQKPAAATNSNSQVLAAVTVYPNPAATSFNVYIAAPTASSVNYVFTDAAGKVVRNGNWQLSAGANAFTLDVLELKGGVYHLRTEGGQINHSARVIVVK